LAIRTADFCMLFAMAFSMSVRLHQWHTSHGITYRSKHHTGKFGIQQEVFTCCAQGRAHAPQGAAGAAVPAPCASVEECGESVTLSLVSLHHTLPLEWDPGAHLASISSLKAP
jgi:hypothetical protein